MRKIAAIVLVLILSLGVSSYAADITASEISAENKITLTGYSEGNKEDVPTYINVFKKNNHLSNGAFSIAKAYADLEAATDKKTVLVYSDYAKTESDGSFEFTVKIDRLANDPDTSPISGAYVANIKCGEKVYQQEFQFVDSEEKAQREEALKELNEIKLLPQDERFDALDTILGDNLYSFVNYMDLLNNVDQTKVHTMIYGYMEETGYDTTNPDETFKYFGKFIVIEALNEGKINNIKDFENELMISSGDMSSWYAKPMVSTEVKKAITERLSKRNVADIDTYEEYLKEALILEYVHASDGISAIRDIVNEFSDDIGIGSYDVTDGALRSVMGNSYKQYSNLASALLNFEEETTSSNKTSSGGGGGSYKLPSEPKEEANKENSGKSKFVDLGSVEWAKEAIEKLYEENIVAGKSSTHFAPLDNITREEFIKLLVLTANLNTKAENLPFEDVSVGAWYHDVVSIAYNNNITTGIDDTHFGVGEKITRQDMAVMVCRILTERGINLEEKNTDGSFADSDLVADYAKTSVEKLKVAGIMNGYDDGRFGPANYTTRAEAAKVIYSLLSLLR